jgi:hypothetical protein
VRSGACVLDTFASHRARRLSCRECGELLGVMELNPSLLRRAYKDRGEDGASGPSTRTDEFGSGCGRGGRAGARAVSYFVLNALFSSRRQTLMKVFTPRYSAWPDAGIGASADQLAALEDRSS